MQLNIFMCVRFQKRRLQQNMCFRVRFLRYITGKVVYKGKWYITKYINFPGYIPNLTSVKMYNKLMFFKTLPKRIRKVLYNIRALVSFQVFGLFCSTWLTPRASNFGLIPEK
jgi:hypothetical protein